MGRLQGSLEALVHRYGHPVFAMGVVLSVGLGLFSFGPHAAGAPLSGGTDDVPIAVEKASPSLSVSSGTLYYLPMVYSDYFDFEALWASLMRYERFVVTYEDPHTGYLVVPGYPQYVQFFGEMYLHLWQHTGDDYYREKLIRCLYFAERIRNDNWTWGTGATKGCPLYNAGFTALFLNAWQSLGDETYLGWAREAVQAFASPDVYDANRQHFRGNYNMNFLSFASIAYFQAVTGQNNPECWTLGKQAFDYALSGYDPLTGRWYYSEGGKRNRFFDGHSAYYELVQVSAFLQYRSAVLSVYPDEGQRILLYLPDMMDQVSTYVLPSGTFYYTAEAPDYTEGAAQTLMGYGYYDQLFGTNHSEFIKSAATTILTRQAPDGGYYKTAGSRSEDVWYSDEIGAFVPVFLGLLEGEGRP